MSAKISLKLIWAGMALTFLSMVVGPVESHAQCVPSPSGLVGWWRAEGNVLDSVGTNHGVLQGSASFVSGKVGPAFRFDGIDGFVRAPDSPVWAFGMNAFTIELWVRFNSVQLNNILVANDVGGGFNDKWLFWHSEGHLSFFVEGGFGGVQLGSQPFAPVTNQFYHLAVTRSGTNYTFYVNGVTVQKVGDSHAVPDVNAPLDIGGCPQEGGLFTDGTFDEISIYHRALTSNEIAAIFSAGISGKCPPPPSPSIFLQPTNQTVTISSNVTFLAEATGALPLSYQWRFNDTNIVGATNLALTLTSVQPGQAGNYTVMVTNLFGTALSSNAVLTVILVPPSITSQPTNRTVVVGSNTTFSVTASGTPPLSYQWRFNGTNVAGATNPSLTLINIQFSQAGNYSVQVTNGANSILSSNAILTVIFPTPIIRALNTNTVGGAQVTVPIIFSANGNENTFGFSMNFNTQRLAFSGVTWAGSVIGAALLVNTNQIGLGRVGFGVSFPLGTTFSPGTQQVAAVTFNSLPVLGVSSVTATNTFGDQPVLRELYDAQFQPISTIYSNGVVTLAPSVFEADVFPRTNGNQAVTTIDWPQMLRFVARLDTATGAEFQRADCAPRGTLGDGQMKVTDWVQAGRYIAGLDPLVAIGGPTNEIAASPSSPSGSRVVRLTNTNVFHNQSTKVSIFLEAQGNENALGFTLAYNPAALTFGAVTLGGGAVEANLTSNTNQIGAGRLGVLVTLGTGSSFGAGSKEIVQVSFVVSPNVAGPFQLDMNDQLVTRCVSDAAANELVVSYTAGAITINPTNANPLLTISLATNDVVLSWDLWAAGFSLQISGGSNGLDGSWTNILGALETNGSKVVKKLPIVPGPRFFRLFHP